MKYRDIEIYAIAEGIKTRMRRQRARSGLTLAEVAARLFRQWKIRQNTAEGYLRKLENESLLFELGDAHRECVSKTYLHQPSYPGDGVCRLTLHEQRINDYLQVICETGEQAGEMLEEILLIQPGFNHERRDAETQKEMVED